MGFDSSGAKAVWAYGLRQPQKGVNYHFSSPHLDEPYVIEKLSILDAKICSFSRMGQKENKLQLF